MDAVDASVAIKRSSAKPAGQEGAAQRAAAQSLTPASTEYRPVQSLPGPLSGLPLQAAVALFESSFGSSLFPAYASRQPGLRQIFEVLRNEALPEEPRPTALHSDNWGAPDLVREETCSAGDAHSRLEAAVHCIQRGGPMAGATKCSTACNVRPTILDYHFAYTHDMITPSEVAERVIAFIETHNPANNWLSAWSAEHIRAAAAASTERYAAGKPLSVMDGVPFVVKDCIDALPYETSFGTRFMGKLHPAKEDAPSVAALKELGAVLLGKGSMVELGIFAHGHNAHAGAVPNPNHPSRTAGGSSSGAAAAVAVGLCPIAIGTDGGGSIRVPASYCGVTGLKTTTGRLADDHGAHRAYSSMVVTGPIANCVADLTLLYAVMANVNYSNTDTRKPGAASLALPGVAEAAAEAAAAPPRPLGLPKVLLEVPEDAPESCNQVDLAQTKPLQGFRVGVFPKWAYDCSPAVADVLRTTLNNLVQLGAQQVEISLPELELAQVGHLATWAKEVAADAETAGWLNDWSLRGQLNLDTRMFVAGAGASITDQDYVQAQRMRARMLSHFKRAFESCDVILTPATPAIAPKLPAAANTTGVYDPAGTYETVRYTLAANLTGLPALVLPGGRQLGNNNTIGVQFMAAPYCEATLLRTAAALEQQQLEAGMPRPVPSVMLNPIQREKGAHPLAREMTKKLWSKKFGKSGGGGGGMF